MTFTCVFRGNNDLVVVQIKVGIGDVAIAENDTVVGVFFFEIQTRDTVDGLSEQNTVLGGQNTVGVDADRL